MTLRCSNLQFGKDRADLEACSCCSTHTQRKHLEQHRRPRSAPPATSSPRQQLTCHLRGCWHQQEAKRGLRQMGCVSPPQPASHQGNSPQGLHSSRRTVRASTPLTLAFSFTLTSWAHHPRGPQSAGPSPRGPTTPRGPPPHGPTAGSGASGRSCSTSPSLSLAGLCWHRADSSAEPPHGLDSNRI